MNLDDPFPLEMVSAQVRRAILDEFQGRCPSIREMTQIPDKHWLAAPGIGSRALQAIRGVADWRSSEVPASSSTVPSDAELLVRLESLQKQLQELRVLLRGRPTKTSGAVNRLMPAMAGE